MHGLLSMTLALSLVFSPHILPPLPASPSSSPSRGELAAEPGVDDLVQGLCNRGGSRGERCRGQRRFCSALRHRQPRAHTSPHTRANHAHTHGHTHTATHTHTRLPTHHSSRAPLSRAPGSPTCSCRFAPAASPSPGPLRCPAASPTACRRRRPRRGRCRCRWRPSPSRRRRCFVRAAPCGRAKACASSARCTECVARRAAKAVERRRSCFLVHLLLACSSLLTPQLSVSEGC